MMLKSFVILFFPACVFCQTVSRQDADRFARALLGHSPALSSWFDADAVAASHRLGIEYEGIDHKNMIGYDFSDSVRQLVNDGRATCTVEVDTLEEQYARVVLAIEEAGVRKEFYFKGRQCISPLDYLTRTWARLDSKHFRFFLSDTTLFSQYCSQELEAFVERMAALLDLNEQELRTLGEDKIYYYLCRDEDEIERLTGYRARGMCNLAYDAVITTFNAHYHELLHLLVNFKLRRLPLYTHPFLQEGLAAAYGGRGGIDPGALLPLGRFLYASDYVELRSLLTKDGFDQLDASLTYPAAGLYNRFLVGTIGIRRYLGLYRVHSGFFADSTTRYIDPSELPDEARWKSFLAGSAAEPVINLDSTACGAHIIFQAGTSTVCEDSTRYHFLLADNLVVPGNARYPGYVSRIFREMMPQEQYKGEKFLIRVSDNEVAVYNLFTNTLIADYAMSFSLPPKKVTRVGGRLSFNLRKDAFDEPLEPLMKGVDGERDK